MKLAFLVLALLPLAAPALADSPPVSKEYCSPYLAFIHPNPPVVCAGVFYAAVNDFCVWVEDVEECVRFIGPVLG